MHAVLNVASYWSLSSDRVSLGIVLPPCRACEELGLPGAEGEILALADLQNALRGHFAAAAAAEAAQLR